MKLELALGGGNIGVELYHDFFSLGGLMRSLERTRGGAGVPMEGRDAMEGREVAMDGGSDDEMEAVSATIDDDDKDVVDDMEGNLYGTYSVAADSLLPGTSWTTIIVSPPSAYTSCAEVLNVSI